jgi:hypothetical protein
MATFSYADAVKFLGAKESKIVTALDKILGGTLLGGSVLDVLGLLGWFDAKADFIRLSHELVAKVSARGISRHTRTQRLHAAHTVIVLVAFFEAFDELGIPLTSKELDLTKQRQLDVHRGWRAQGALHETDIPAPTPGQSYEGYLETLKVHYDELAEDLAQMTSRLAVWDDLDDTRKYRLLETMKDDLPSRSIVRYEELFRRLAVDCPEVAFWTAQLDGQATRAEVGTALARLEQLLLPVTLGDVPTAQRAELARKYRAVLDHPILESDDAPGGVSIPSLRHSYIDPVFQVGEAGPGVPFAQKSWWESVTSRGDVHRFLAGFLTSPNATSVPLLVLGDPGSGKSVLTKVLAAQLPASDFLVLRVQLRSVPTEADVLQQIEHSLREILQEQVSWASLVRSAGQALPVVLLDGFDELLQATGVSQTDYLMRIARFQRNSADVGRPVAFVVTSRISVADRANVPESTVVLRLSPFDEAQIDRWLTVWNRTNARHFTHLKPLAPEVVARYPQLSEQPLLLLMLALYDADDNALQHDTELVGEAELYERLLTRFAVREVVKDGQHRGAAELAAAVEAELERLSIVAFAMFNRGTQWVTEQDLDDDLAALLGTQQARTGTRAPLGVGERVLGRFFFVQRAQATRDQRTLRTYEFLHATFGEYLVARLTWRVLLDLVEVEQNRPRRKLSSTVDDSELHALLSFSALCVRAPVLYFLQEMSEKVEDSQREAIVGLLTGLFQVVGESHPNRTLTEYQPVELSVPARYAAYSANLVLLTVVAARKLRVSELCGDPSTVAEIWYSCALLWKSQLRVGSWEPLMTALNLQRTWNGDDREIELSLRPPGASVVLQALDFEWSIGNRGTGDRRMTVYRPWDATGIEAHFLCGTTQDMVSHALDPVSTDFPDSLRTFAKTSSGQWVSGAHAVLSLLIDSELMPPENGFGEYIGAIAEIQRVEPTALYEHLVLAALDMWDPDSVELIRTPWLMHRPGYWALLCERIGRGGDSQALTSTLSQIWDEEKALVEIPEQVVEAWLRMAERRSVIPRPAPDLLQILHRVDLEKLARTRPDLIKRAQNVLTELGELRAIKWPGR